MTRDELLRELVTAWGPARPLTQYSPFCDDEAWSRLSSDEENAWTERIVEWGRSADPGRIDALLGLLTAETLDLSPYAREIAERWEIDEGELDREAFNYKAGWALVGWEARAPDALLQRAAGLLRNRHARYPVLRVMSFLAKPSYFPLLSALADEADRLLSECPWDFEQLISALSSNGDPRARLCLLALQDRLTDPDALAAIERGLTYRLRRYGHEAGGS